MKPEQICFPDFLSYRWCLPLSLFIFLFFLYFYFPLILHRWYRSSLVFSPSNWFVCFLLKHFINSSLMFCSSLHFLIGTDCLQIVLFLFSFLLFHIVFSFIFSLLFLPFKPSYFHLCMFVFIFFFSFFNFYFFFILEINFIFKHSFCFKFSSPANHLLFCGFATTSLLMIKRYTLLSKSPTSR